jgi:sugar O-acyltransferase (sialic acid O-acetyltransferase NeuD family)
MQKVGRFVDARDLGDNPRMMSPTGQKHRLIIYGGGGHGLVVAEAAAHNGWKIAGFVDDNLPAKHHIGCWSVIDKPDDFGNISAMIIVAIGDNETRAKVVDQLRAAGAILASVVHPSAIISPSAVIEGGVFVGPRAVVNAEAHIGVGAIINSAAIIEHHVTVGAMTHIAPASVLCGGVSIGESCLIGANATVLPKVRIGRQVTVGAGSVIPRDLSDGVTAIGNPPRIVRDE